LRAIHNQHPTASYSQSPRRADGLSIQDPVPPSPKRRAATAPQPIAHGKWRGVLISDFTLRSRKAPLLALCFLSAKSEHYFMEILRTRRHLRRRRSSSHPEPRLVRPLMTLTFGIHTLESGVGTASVLRRRRVPAPPWRPTAPRGGVARADAQIGSRSACAQRGVTDAVSACGGWHFLPCPASLNRDLEKNKERANKCRRFLQRAP
jgi:hypothetical protein